MQINSLRLQNFRSFTNQDFAFQPQFNLLIGDNGTGKTAVLEALAVGLGAWLDGFYEAKSRPITQEDIRLEGRLSGSGYTYELRAPVEVQLTGTIDGQPCEWTRRRTSLRSGTRNTGRMTALADAANARVIAREPYTLPVTVYYGVDRLQAQPVPPPARSRRSPTAERTPAASSTPWQRAVGYADALEERVSAGGLTKWLRDQSDITYRTREEPGIARVVRAAMTKLIEDASDVLYDNERLTVVVLFRNGDVRPMMHLSAGQRSMMALAGDLAMRMAALNPHLDAAVLQETPGVVLIDELDMHLHPTWQRHVIEDLRNTFPCLQFIATTHSPFIVQTARAGELLPLDAQPIPETANQSIEAISEGLMGVENSDRSPRYLEMVDVAKQFLQTLDEAQAAPEEKLKEYKHRLAEQVGPYADNPAFQAILELERVDRLGS